VLLRKVRRCTLSNISLYAAAIALALGASRVDFLGGDPHHCEVAARLGANVIEGPDASSKNYDRTYR